MRHGMPNGALALARLCEPRMCIPNDTEGPTARVMARWAVGEPGRTKGAHSWDGLGTGWDRLAGGDVPFRNTIPSTRSGRTALRPLPANRKRSSKCPIGYTSFGLRTNSSTM